MGANQSAPGSEARGGGAGSSNGADVKTCYYDLLGLERQATDEEWALHHELHKIAVLTKLALGSRRHIAERHWSCTPTETMAT